jgi:hypothetical protein
MRALEKLTAALSEAGPPNAMVEQANEGYYDEVWSWLIDDPDPIEQLIADARACGLLEIAERAMLGHFAATEQDIHEWREAFRTSASAEEKQLLCDLSADASEYPDETAFELVRRRLASFSSDDGRA